MHLAAKWIIVFLVSCASVCARAGASWEGSLSCKNALTKGKVTTDVAFALSGSWEPFTVQGTWKADEKGFASFRLTEELELASSVDLRGELLFKRKGLDSITLSAGDLSVGTTELDVEGVFRREKTLSLYEVSSGLRHFNVGACPATGGLLLREDYARLRLGLDGTWGDLDLEATCRKGSLDGAKVTASGEVAGWSLSQVVRFLFAGRLPKPKDGTFTAKRDLSDLWSVTAACEQGFSGGGIELSRLVLSTVFEAESARLSWTGAFLLRGAALSLDGWDFALTGAAPLGSLSVEGVLRLDEGGLRSLSLEIAASFSG